jgi:plastin-1
MEKKEIPLIPGKEVEETKTPMIVIPKRRPSGRTEMEKLQSGLEFINKYLSTDPTLKAEYSLVDEAKLMEAMQNGILLSKLINFTLPGTIDEKTLISTLPLTNYQKIENLKIALAGATLIGCASSVITPHMILQGKSTLVISMIDQLRRVYELQELTKTPELAVLAEKGESLDDVYKLLPEKLIIRWLNFQLTKAGVSQKIVDMGKDLQSGELYLHVLHQIDPKKCSLEGIKESDNKQRMNIVIKNAVDIGVRYTINIDGLITGNKSMHMFFCCILFNANNGLKSPAEGAQ